MSQHVGARFHRDVIDRLPRLDHVDQLEQSPGRCLNEGGSIELRLGANRKHDERDSDELCTNSHAT